MIAIAHFMTHPMLKDKFKKKIRNIIRAIQLVWKACPGWSIASLMLLLLQGILPLGQIYIAKLVVDTASLSLTAPDRSVLWAQALPLLLLLGGVTLLIKVANTIATIVNTAQEERVTDYMQGILYEKSIDVDLEYYESHIYHDILRRATEEAPYRPGEILSNLNQFCYSSISLVTMVGLLLLLHWGIVVVLILSALPAMLAKLTYSGVMYRWERNNTFLERQAEYRGWLLSEDRSAKELRLFNLGQYFLQQFHQIRRKIFKQKLAIKIRWSYKFLAAQGASSLFIFSIYIFIVYQTIHGVLKLGDLVLYHQALNRGQNALTGLTSGLSGLYEDNLYLNNLFEFLELKPRLIEPNLPITVPVPMRSGLVLKNVCFQYASTSRLALRNINLMISPGETIALVGENGSGKTTLVKLLCRLYEPTAGHITLDGIDLRKYSIKDWRRQISVIFQDYVRYHLTAQENIRLGNVEYEADHPKIEKAAYYSGADEVVKSLPKGYSTVLGNWFEGGEELSIGQWQKIALARAFVRESQLIILDEPTSAMDPRAESDLLQQFQKLISNQTAILISHRLSSVKMADRIYVMDGGQIVEYGSHEYLMSIDGTYAHLFKIQAKKYR